MQCCKNSFHVSPSSRRIVILGLDALPRTSGAKLVGLIGTAHAARINSGVVWRLALALSSTHQRHIVKVWILIRGSYAVDDGIGPRALRDRLIVVAAGPLAFGTRTCIGFFCMAWRSTCGSLGLGRVPRWRSRCRVGVRGPRRVFVWGSERGRALHVSFRSVAVHGDPVLDALFWLLVPAHEVVIDVIEALGPGVDTSLLQVNEMVAEATPEA